MPDTSPSAPLNLQLLVPLTGVVALLILVRRGCLRAGVFAGAPSRDVGLGLVDLWAGLVLMFMGMVVAVQVFTFIGWGGPDEDPNHPPMLVARAMLGQGLIQLPVAMFFIARSSRRPAGLRQVGIIPARLIRDIRSGGLALLAVLPMVIGLGVVIEWFVQWLGHPGPDFGHDLLRVLAQSQSTHEVLGLMVSAVVLAPILEEFIFRGLLQTSLLDVMDRSNRWVVVFISAAVFAAIHANQPWQVLPSLFLLGVFLGWLYERTGSLWPGIILHAGFNATNTALVLLIRIMDNLHG